jgi:NAD-dependent dihydropyrimidine dehydrogenase PreA subunit
MICIEVCPYDVMFAQKDSDIPAKCNHCGECARTCPRNAIICEEAPESEVA